MSANDKLSPVEKIKQQSHGLRGTLTASLEDAHTGQLRDDDQHVIKFHGIYQQDDRDRREARAEKKLERLYSYMVRLRLPGGTLTAPQWQAIHHIAGEFSTGVIKITTRQTLQLHGIVKAALKPVLQSFDRVALDSIATCGDINRNVICAAHPAVSPVHQEIHTYAHDISTLLMPKSKAYYEIWLDQEKLTDEKAEEDPLYQDRYMPRKFKIAIAIPPDNDVDVFGHDIGLIAVIEADKLIGFNLCVGGGLSSTHGNAQTYPRIGTLIGFVRGREQTLKAVYEVLTIQRDFGNRTDRKQARLKYTLDTHGVDWFKKELEQRTGFPLEPARPFQFERRGDVFGWSQNASGRWFYTVFVESGRVTDSEQVQLKRALYEIAAIDTVVFRFTANQNVILDVNAAGKQAVEAILEKYGVARHTETATPIRRDSIACVAFNTCPLALAEAQRYLPSLITKIESLMTTHGIAREGISIRMTGCPNGCGRPYLAEIGLIGTSYGHYNLHLGGDHLGLRLNKKFRENLDEMAILKTLNDLFAIYSLERNAHETFGDFALRKQWIN